MSEVLGAVITFGIAAMLLVGSVIGFRVLQDRATDRSVQSEADAVAVRVAAAVTAAAHVAAQDDASTPVNEFERRLDLPEQLEGRDYHIEFSIATGAPTILVTGSGVPTTQRALTGVPQSLVCVWTSSSATIAGISGGPMLVRYSKTPPAGCPPASFIFLESA